MKTEEQDLMRDVWMKSIDEDFEEEQQIMFWTLSWVIGGTEVIGVTVKEWSACGGVGEEMALLEAILAFMDCILEWKKAEGMTESLFFLIRSSNVAVGIVH